jgi:hypothetical protein
MVLISNTFLAEKRELHVYNYLYATVQSSYQIPGKTLPLPNSVEISLLCSNYVYLNKHYAFDKDTPQSVYHCTRVQVATGTWLGIM